MTEETSAAESSEEKNSTDDFRVQHAAGGGGMRKLLLLVVLLAVLGVFAYDQFVTKSDFSEVRDEIAEMQTLDGLKKKGDHNGDGFITPSDVKLTAGRDPSATDSIGEQYTIETYSWPRIIPGMTYDVYAVYRKGAQRSVLFSVATERPDEASLPKAPVIGEPGSVSNPVVGGLQPDSQRPDRDRKTDDDATKADKDDASKSNEAASESGDESSETASDNKGDDKKGGGGGR